MADSVTLALSILFLKCEYMMKPNHSTFLLLTLCLAIASCSDNRKPAGLSDLAGTWEVNLSQSSDVSTHKGQVVFKDSRYVYTWYQLMEDSSTQSREWNPIEMEQGNVIIEQVGIMALLSDSYGIPIRSSGIQNRDKIDYEIKPSKSDYLIHYETQNDTLVWMEDSNFDGDFDDVNEKFIYKRVK